MLKQIAMLTVVFGLFGATAARADAVIPTKDIAGARDNALLKRYDGSFIVSYERLAFTDFKVPLSRLEKAGDDQRDRMNNQVFKPKKESKSRARALVLPICYRPDARRWRCCATIRTS